MPLQVGPIRGRELRRHDEHHCTCADRRLSEEQSCEPPMVPKPAAVRRRAIRSMKSGLVGREGSLTPTAFAPGLDLAARAEKRRSLRSDEDFVQSRDHLDRCNQEI